MADLEARVKELEGKLQEMMDREQIRDLRYRYHEYVNEGKYKEIPSLFAEDGEIDFAHLGKGKGREAIGKFYGAIAGDAPTADKDRPRITFVKQFIHNHTIQLHGDHGHGVSYLEAKPIFGGEAFLVAARFNDDYVKRNGEWKFQKMTLLPYFMVPLKEGWAQEDKIKMR
jgi:hypothetical protein